jgi:hypothetical protein
MADGMAIPARCRIVFPKSESPTLTTGRYQTHCRKRELPIVAIVRNGASLPAECPNEFPKGESPTLTNGRLATPDPLSQSELPILPIVRNGASLTAE